MSADETTMMTSVSFFVTSPSAVVRGTKRGSDAAFGIGLLDGGDDDVGMAASKRRKSARLSAVSMKLASASVEGDASTRGEEPAGTREPNRDDAEKTEKDKVEEEEEEKKKKTSLKTLPKPRGLATRLVNVPAPKVIPAPKVLPEVVASESSAQRTRTKTIPAPKKVIPAPRAM